MNTNFYMLQVGNISALVVHKAIKNLHLSVLPPLGKVRVAAPLAMREDAIRTLLATRLAWIKKQQAKFEGQKRQTRREYVSGESHYLWGKRRRLEVVYEDTSPGIVLKGKNRIILNVRPKSSLMKREQVIRDCYRKELRNIAAGLIERWQKKTNIQINTWGIKRMKTKWGSCNQKAKRIWLNLELAKKPEHCLSFIIVHEMTHILVKYHNDQFKAYIDKFMPKWKQYKEELNNSVLSYEKWKY